jgi:hypothetical protein
MDFQKLTGNPQVNKSTEEAVGHGYSSLIVPSKLTETAKN